MSFAKLLSVRDLEGAKMYVNAYLCLEEEGYLVFEGNDGGQIYLTIPVTKVRASEMSLLRLLSWMDRMAWPSNGGEGRFKYFVLGKAGDSIIGGMGGGQLGVDLWTHEEFHPFLQSIRQALTGDSQAVFTRI